MSSQNNGGAAFPATEAHGLNSGDSRMTLRDYFAAKAMEGLLAHIIGVKGAGPDGYAKRAYEYADAMLAAREKE